MLLFNFSAFEQLANELAEQSAAQRGDFLLARFPNQELTLTLLTPVAGEHCLVLGSTAPPDENLMSLLLLCDTLKRRGAAKVTAMLPYLGYTRQDKDEMQESLTAAWVGTMLKSCGVDDVVTIEIHSSAVGKLFPIPVTSLSSAPLLAGALKKHGITGTTIVAPDEGATALCQAVAKHAGLKGNIAYLKKIRAAGQVQHLSLTGNPGKRVVVLDDILDTGSTLVSCCQQLQRKGAHDITVMVTHGLFTGKEWEQLWALGVRACSVQRRGHSRMRGTRHRGAGRPASTTTTTTWT
jgi:ribose-phosphate pyrophosphokinase